MNIVFLGEAIYKSGSVFIKAAGEITGNTDIQNRVIPV